MENVLVTHSIEGHGLWHTASTTPSSVHGSPFFAHQRTSSTGSLFQELNDQDYIDSMDHYSPPPLSSGSEWSTPAPLPHPALPAHMQQQQHHDHAMSRRASFPSARS